MIAVETWKSELSQKNGLHQDNLLHVLIVDYLFRSGVWPRAEEPTLPGKCFCNALLCKLCNGLI